MERAQLPYSRRRFALRHVHRWSKRNHDTKWADSTPTP